MERDYLTRLARAARWYLPPAEAAEVLEDYQEIAGARTDKELERDLGSPRKVIQQLARPKVYRRWLAVFVVLAVCVLLPAVGPIWQRLTWRTGIYVVTRLDWVLLLLGLALSFLWFRRSGKRKGTLLKGMLPVMLLPLVGMTWTWFVALSALYNLDPLTRFLIGHPDAVRLLHSALLLGGFAMGLTGLAGLFRARMGDRRWRAVYAWGLTGAVLCFSVWSLLTNMALPITVENWQTAYLMRYLFITLAGLVGTAVSLC